MSPRWSPWPNVQHILSVVAGWHFSVCGVCEHAAAESALVCLHIPYAVQHENWSPFMHLGKSSRALCTGGHCELLCKEERARDSSWSCNRSVMESVVNQRLASVGKSVTLANGKSKDKLTPKFTASLLLVLVERKMGTFFPLWQSKE